MVVNYSTAENAVKEIKSGQRVFVHGSASTPMSLLRALFKRSVELKDVELVSITTLGDDLFNIPDFGASFFMNSLFVSKNVRQIVNGTNGDYIPVFLSEIPILFDKGILALDVALIHVSEPDKHGFCSLGTSVDIARSAVKNAKHIIAQVNKQMPRTHGDGIIHISEINTLVNVDEALPEVNYGNRVDETAMTIGRFCAELIEDRSTLQMGIGAIPDAVLSCLRDHKDLGIHTEMFSDGVIPLVETGVITNKFKKKHRGKIVTGFAIGTRKLYDFVDDNPQVVFLEIDYVNDTKVIRANPKAVSINSAIEIDLTGQVCADSIGTYQYSGVGGQIDFMRGAALSEGGKPIIALPSTTKTGESKIVPFLKEGAGVVTTRAHVHYVVTEYGVAYLFGKNLRQRAMALIAIAHPMHREWLEKEVIKRFDMK
ncbi:MAG: 4-hydroxybutyrate CoA-transferase [Sphingobacteriales bacterium 17-39-43]|uniref:acetyl-CoA hydrolase/transferase family protein n=1 Tax=Daejeonella sp. TaxID=2805397 RepID=UPI000BCDC0D7|nr:acetyl-CoA hydrolase/transferase C-terminal domain-containing protein [Daejeonella sp.]OYZ32990.1 MAG: 4-hydroxybutyrate CoA-transferase [Sphingobacteriales bacterium 16-39-50]OZA26400.1 MAG: 4-hydroxybutyrate CoA-transferase [Sphingobacteriales bacterium 17-39-43]HQT21534.1 acetyl-CoA hydrolase/transferase C-terminal domain-containing protein [Daejeonella sp.]HQT56265.1 acetyl-CoA hydrolase/transferase C-terminal domain-containing protein [Daejeonella sp.]